MQQQRGQPSLSFHVRGGGYDEPADPREARGGGLVDVMALAARIADGIASSCTWDLRTRTGPAGRA